jgi:hypothetical protein
VPELRYRIDALAGNFGRIGPEDGADIALP